MKNFLRILTAVVICLAIGGLSGFATSGAIEGWYVTINKPSFNPPNWLFGPVWTLLYIMMGIAAGMVWNAGWDKRPVRMALAIFAAQLFFNGMWSILFFILQNPMFALVDIVLLLNLIALTFIRFKPINKVAAYLLVPYLLWVSFAAVLNAAIWWLN